MQFEVGETVVYPHHGAAKIIEVKKRKLGGEEKLFLKLQVNQGDLTIEVPAVTAADLILPAPAEGSREVAARVARARDIQAERYAALNLAGVRTNAQAQGSVLEQVVHADAAGMTLLRDAADAMRLSARSYHRVLRVARTLADLDGADAVGRVHLAEALSYRTRTDDLRRAA